MTVSRRSFLGGALALVGTAMVPIKAELLASVPMIYGDGVHDDRPGLQALIDNKPFRVAGECGAHRMGDGTIYLSSGTYYLGDAIEIADSRAFISDCTFRSETDTVLYLRNSTGSHLRNCVMQSGKARSKIGRYGCVLEYSK